MCLFGVGEAGHLNNQRCSSMRMAAWGEKELCVGVLRWHKLID